VRIEALASRARHFGRLGLENLPGRHGHYRPMTIGVIAFASTRGAPDTPGMGGEPALRTPLCDAFGIQVPIVQAPIGRAGGPELAAAVSDAGALGMLGVTFLDPVALRRSLAETNARTEAPFGANLILAWDQRERLAVCLEAGVRIVSYFWADLAPGSPYIQEAHAAGASVLLTVGSAEEARRAVDAGVDVIVAQGLDAGGHVWGSVGTIALVPAVVDAVSPTPVIAAGGIGDGRGLAAVLALGAQAAWMGTRFVVADESLGHLEYKDRVVAARETDGVWSTGVFDRGFSEAPVRTLDNSTLRIWRDAGSPAPGGRPGEEEALAHRPDGEPICRYDFAPPVVGMTGDMEAMANYAGQSAGVVKRRQPAADIVREVAEEAARILGRSSD
jgi:nitronate monooxygenase